MLPSSPPQEATTSAAMAQEDIARRHHAWLAASGSSRQDVQCLTTKSKTGTRSEAWASRDAAASAAQIMAAAR